MKLNNSVCYFPAFFKISRNNLQHKSKKQHHFYILETNKIKTEKVGFARGITSAEQRVGNKRIESLMSTKFKIKHLKQQERAI